jgi:hypothetical protein
VTENNSPRFDEKAALAELDRLQEEIRAARQVRQSKVEEFDRFIRSFRDPAPPPPEGERGTIGRHRSIDTWPTTDSRIVTRTPRNRHRGALIAAAAGAVIVLVVAVPRFRSSRPTAPPTAAVVTGSGAHVSRPPTAPSPAAIPRAVTTAPPIASLPSAASSSPAVPPAADAAAVRVELRTLAPVWMRVVTDDQKKIEGVVAAGERLSFTAERSIVVRAGNGGDVLVKIADREDPFGTTGQPLTRTFSPRQK